MILKRDEYKVRKYNNLSNGTTDGFTLFYLKDGKLCSVLLNEEQAQCLDLSLGVAFGSQDKIRVVKCDKQIMNDML